MNKAVMNKVVMNKNLTKDRYVSNVNFPFINVRAHASHHGKNIESNNSNSPNWNEYLFQFEIKCSYFLR